MNGNVIGYTMVNDRYQDKYYFDGTAYDIARFIMQFGQGRAVRIIITDLTDGFILSAYGEFWIRSTMLSMMRSSKCYYVYNKEKHMNR